jgi:hypothetical protein
LLEFVVEQRLPAFPELVGTLVEMADRATDQGRASSSKEGFGCRIRFAADGLVVQDQNGVERILND